VENPKLFGGQDKHQVSSASTSGWSSGTAGISSAGCAVMVPTDAWDDGALGGFFGEVAFSDDRNDVLYWWCGEGERVRACGVGVVRVDGAGASETPRSEVAGAASTAATGVRASDDDEP